jgi:FKBP-type peptidyl-prolyl cis-trans isomerase
MMRSVLTLIALVGLTICATAQTAKQIPAPANLKTPPPNAARKTFVISSVVLKPGTGKSRPGPTDTVTVNYTGWTSDGKTFDTTSGGEPATFARSEVITGWTEGLQLMVEGETRRFWIPEQLAYRGRREPYGTLVFDIELISIKK